MGGRKMTPQTVLIPAGSYIEDAAKLTLNSVDSYMKMQNMPRPTTPEEKLFMKENAKKPFYAKIVPAAPILMQYILEADMSTNQQAIALDYAYMQHILDREFIDMLMQYLSQPGQTSGARAAVGAYLAHCMDSLVEQTEKKIVKVPTTVTLKNANGEDETKTETVEKEIIEYKYKPDDIKFITDAVSTLLGATANWVQSEYPTLNDAEAIGTAAAVCMANDHSIKMLIDMNLAITAKVFDMLDNDGQNKIITTALELKKEDFQKLTSNQESFIDSLKRWVYGKLNFLDTSTCYQFLVGVYGSTKPSDLNNRLIYIKDCGTSFVNLLQVAKQLEA